MRVPCAQFREHDRREYTLSKYTIRRPADILEIAARCVCFCNGDYAVIQFRTHLMRRLFVRRSAILVRTKVTHGRDGDCARVHKSTTRRSCPCATYYPKIIKIPIVNGFPEVAREKGRESFVYIVVSKKCDVSLATRFFYESLFFCIYLREMLFNEFDNMTRYVEIFMN